MSDREYAVVMGIVQGGKLAPKEREVNNQTVMDVLVKTTKQELVKVTIWPEFEVEVEPGDFVAIDGSYQESTYKGNTYYNVNPYSLAVVKPVTKKEREVVQKDSTTATKKVNW